MNNLGSSWLSRELLAGVLFGGFGAAFAISQWFGWLTRGIREIIAILTAVAGLFLLIAMSGVYYSTSTIPAWNNVSVPLFFFESALLTPLAVAVALLIVWTSNPLAKIRKQAKEPLNAELVAFLRASLRGLSVVATVAGIAIFVTYPIYLLALSHGGDAAEYVASEISTSFLLWRLLLLGIAVVIAGVFAFSKVQTANQPQKVLIVLIVLALVLALTSELMGRSIHYDGLWREGLNTWQTIAG